MSFDIDAPLDFQQRRAPDPGVNGTFETTLGTIQIDDKSILALATTKCVLTTEGSTVAWTMANNATVNITSANIDTMLDEVVAFQTAAFERPAATVVETASPRNCRMTTAPHFIKFQT